MCLKSYNSVALCNGYQVPAEQVQNILNSQISRPERLRLADDVVLNTVPVFALQPQIQQLHSRYQQFAKEKTRKKLDLGLW